MAIGATTAALLIISAGGTLIKAAGQRQQQLAARNIAIANSHLAEFNTRTAVGNAVVLQAGANLQALRARKQKESFLSRQRAAFAKAGVRSTGSPFEVIVDSAAEMELDLQTDFFNASFAANQEITRAHFSRYQAQLQIYQAEISGSQAVIQPLLTIGGEVIKQGTAFALNRPSTQKAPIATRKPGLD